MLRLLFCALICLGIAVGIGLWGVDRRQYFSDLKKAWKVLFGGLVLHFILLILFSKSQVAINVISAISDFMMRIKEATLEGTKFVFGYLSGKDLPFDVKPGTSGFIFAFQALPTIILVSVLSAILNYAKILPYVAKFLGSLFGYVFKLSKSLGMFSFAKIFLGQLEAPMLIKSELENLQKFDIFVIMSLAFATTAASVMPVYSDALAAVCPNAMNHLIISSVINVVATLIICRLQYPAIEQINTAYVPNKIHKSFSDAVLKGLGDGASTWWAVVGSLIGMVALVSLINSILGFFPNVRGCPITLQRIAAIIMYPIAWLLDINGNDIMAFSQLLGTKMTINETVAFFDLGQMNLAPSTVIKAIYILNNFGNFACVGITVVGLSAMAPNQKYISEIAGRAFITGFIATVFTTATASLFL